MSIQSSFFSSSITFEGRKYEKEEYASCSKYKEYSVYSHAGKNSEIAEIKLWRPLSELHTCGNGAFEGPTQLYSYFPVISFWTAPMLWYQAYHILKDRVLNNENFIRFPEHIDHNRKVILRREGLLHAPLSRFQRMAIAAIAVAQMVRGTFALLCIGILFLPFDLLLEHIVDRGGTYTGKTFIWSTSRRGSQE